MDNRIKDLRQARELTLQELADLVGTSNQQISQLETGRRRINVDWLERLSKVLECHPFELLYEGAIADDDSEIQLLSMYRLMTKEQKTHFLSITTSLLSMLTKEETHGRSD